MDSISRKLENGVGFSYGCAELTLKNSPPFVPSCLIAICEAAGTHCQRLLSQRNGIHDRIARSVFDRIATWHRS